MPKLRKIATRVPLSTTIPSKEISESLLLDKDLPNRITSSPTKAALFPFAVRAVIDSRSNKPLTPLQDKVVRFLQRSKADLRLMRQYERMPKKVQDAFNQKYFTGTQVDAEKLLKSTISTASDEIHKGLQASFKAKKTYVLTTAFKPFYVPYETW